MGQFRHRCRREKKKGKKKNMLLYRPTHKQRWLAIYIYTLNPHLLYSANDPHVLYSTLAFDPIRASHHGS